MSTEKIENIKLRNFNDLNKEDVITTVQRVVASKNTGEVEISTYASAEAEQIHYALSKDEAEKIQSEYKDRNSEKYDSISDQLVCELRDNAEDNMDVSDYYDDEVETEIEEVSIDQMVRRKYPYRSERYFEDQLIDHSEVKEGFKSKVLNDLNFDKDKHTVELVLKGNVKTFVIVKKENSESSDLSKDQ